MGSILSQNGVKRKCIISKYFLKQSLLETGWETYFLQKSNKEGNIHDQ